MKSFAVWLLLTAALYMGLGVPTHVYLRHNPRRVLIALDTSFQMRPVWARVTTLINSLPQGRYTQFSIITDKARVHGWQKQPRLDDIQLYGPRDLRKLLDGKRYAEIHEADQIYLVTNSTDLTALGKYDSNVTVLNPVGP